MMRLIVCLSILTFLCSCTGTKKDSAYIVLHKEGWPLLINNSGNANLDHTDQFGQTPLIRAAKGNSSDLAMALIKNGVDVEPQDNIGMSALFWAVVRRNHELVRELLSAGASPNRNNITGDSPLSVAVFNNDLEMTELLLSNRTIPFSGNFSWRNHKAYYEKQKSMTEANCGGGDSKCFKDFLAYYTENDKVTKSYFSTYVFNSRRFNQKYRSNPLSKAIIFNNWESQTSPLEFIAVYDRPEMFEVIFPYMKQSYRDYASSSAIHPNYELANVFALFASRDNYRDIVRIIRAFSDENGKLSRSMLEELEGALAVAVWKEDLIRANVFLSLGVNADECGFEHARSVIKLYSEPSSNCFAYAMIVENYELASLLMRYGASDKRYKSWREVQDFIKEDDQYSGPSFLQALNRSFSTGPAWESGFHGNRSLSERRSIYLNVHETDDGEVMQSSGGGSPRLKITDCALHTMIAKSKDEYISASEKYCPARELAPCAPNCGAVEK